MPKSNIYVSSGSDSNPFYSFYKDADGRKEVKNLKLNIFTTYNFYRLNDATSHPFYIKSYSSRNDLILSGEGSDNKGIYSTKSFTLSFNDSIDLNSDIYYFCTSHTSMQSNIELIATQKIASVIDGLLVSDQILGNNYKLSQIKDFNGRLHANTGSVSDSTKSSYKYQGFIDINADGTKEAIYTNKESARWVTASVDSVTGEIDYSDYGEGGITKIVGIYEDPLIAEGASNGGFLSDSVTPAPANFGVSEEERYVEVNGETIDRLALNSQVRFQNDLEIDNLAVKTSGDYDNDGVNEVYWKTNDGTAYLRALMHDDGNIRYANYQSESQMTEYLTAQGHESVVEEIV